MKKEFSMSFDDAPAPATWLSGEIFSFAQKNGASESDAERLRTLVGILAGTLAENGEAYLKVVASCDIDFLKAATKVSSLACVVGTPETFDAGKLTPLIFEEQRAMLYLYRHYKQEVCIVRHLRHKVTHGRRRPLPENARKIIDVETPFPLNAEQKAAVQAILSSDFTIVSGGPGTGKTTLLLRALLCIFDENPSAQVLLAAPTGKAAARMKESVLSQAELMLQTSGATGALVTEAFKKTCALESVTLHRVLKTGAALLTMTPPREINADYLIIDEASMIDQALMYRLVKSLSARTRLVLLGDKNQLDSVGAGQIFGALCATDEFAASRAELVESRRFSEHGLLGRLARAVVRGDVEGAKTLVSESVPEPANAEVFKFSSSDFSENVLDAALENLFSENLRRVPENADPDALLREFESVRLLTPLRNGPFGTDALNARARSLFAPGASSTQPYFHGQPIIVMKNAPQERLYNGDVGIVLYDAAATAFFAYFRHENGGLKKIPVSMLPEHESAYAMSIHKSQGSEFSRLCVVFPPSGARSEFFSRQLLYTAITRFREGGESSYFNLIFDQDALLGAVARDYSLKPLCGL